MNTPSESVRPGSSAHAFAARLTRLEVGETYMSDHFDQPLEYLGVAMQDGERVAVFRIYGTTDRCYLGTLRGFKKGERFTPLAAAHGLDTEIGGEG